MSDVKPQPGDASNDNGPPTFQDLLFEQSYPNAATEPEPEPKVSGDVDE